LCNAKIVLIYPIADSNAEYTSIAFTLSDTTPPMVVGVSTSDEVWSTDGKKLESASILLSFSESLYAVNSSGTGGTQQDVYPVDSCKLLAPGHPTSTSDKNYSIAVGSLAPSTSGISVKGEDDHKDSSSPINTITLDLKNLQVGGKRTIVFKNLICDQSRNGLIRNPLSVTATVVRTNIGTDKDPDYVYSLEVSVNAPWDGMK